MKLKIIFRYLCIGIMVLLIAFVGCSDPFAPNVPPLLQPIPDLEFIGNYAIDFDDCMPPHEYMIYIKGKSQRVTIENLGDQEGSVLNAYIDTMHLVIPKQTVVIGDGVYKMEGRATKYEDDINLVYRKERLDRETEPQECSLVGRKL